MNLLRRAIASSAVLAAAACALLPVGAAASEQVAAQRAPDPAVATVVGREAQGHRHGEFDVGPRPGHPVLEVDDRRAVGSVGDRRLSLAEAIRLANGDLTVADLSPAERGQIRGRPGPITRDTIRPVVRHIVSTPTDPGPTAGFHHHHLPPSLPVLEGNDGDVLDGRGATLSNGADVLGPIGGLAFLVRSSDITIRDWRLERFFNMVEIDAPDGQGISRVAVQDNVMWDGGGVYVDAIAADGGRTTVRDVAIRGNRIIGPPAVADGRTHPATLNLPVHAAAIDDSDPAWEPTAPGRSLITGLRVEDNYIRGFTTGGSFLGVSASTPGTTVSRGDLKHLLVMGNDVALPTGAVDPGFMVWGAARTFPGVAGDARVRNVEVVDNQFRGGTLPFYAAAAENVFGSGMVRGVTWKGLVIRGNTMVSDGTCAAGLMVTTAFHDIGGGAIRDASMTDVVIANNRTVDCTSGMFLSPTVFMAGHGTTSGVELQHVTVTGNTVRGAVDGITASGAIVHGNPALNADTGTPGATATGNLFADLAVRANTLAVTAHAIGLYGAVAFDTTGVLLTDNSLTGARVGRNRAIGGVRCIATADGATPPSGVVAGNFIAATGC